MLDLWDQQLQTSKAAARIGKQRRDWKLKSCETKPYSYNQSFLYVQLVASHSEGREFDQWSEN